MLLLKVDRSCECSVELANTLQVQTERFSLWGVVDAERHYTATIWSNGAMTWRKYDMNSRATKVKSPIGKSTTARLLIYRGTPRNLEQDPSPGDHTNIRIVDGQTKPTEAEDQESTEV